MSSSSKKFLAYFHTIIFVIVLIGVSFFFFWLPKEGVSLSEKRKLAAKPVLTMNNVLSGSYANSADLYFADNFPYREMLLDFSFKIKQARGLHSGDIAIYRNLGIMNNEKFGKALIGVNDTLMDSLRNANVEGDLLGNGLFIYNGAALQLFGGSESSAKYYASIINKYQAELKGTVTIYNVIFPTPTEFYLPDEYSKLTRPEKPNIDIINANLDPGIKAVDAYSLFKEHSTEYLYYRTDHHETVLGAYYAYAAFCNSAGITPLQLKDMTRKVKYKYLGSLYSMTHDPRLLERPDSVEYYIIPGNYKTSVYYASNPKRAIKSQLLVEGSWGYGVFIGGDNPLTKVETDLNNGKRVLIVKNSFGNAFVPFFAAHYEEVFAVDYRYFNLGLINFIVENKVTDLVFVNCTILANARWHAQCINRIMTVRGQPALVPKDTTKKVAEGDSLSVKEVDSLKLK